MLFPDNFLEKDKEMNFKFDWRYAVDKLLIMLTSGKTFAVLVPAIVALTGFELPELLQLQIMFGSGIVISILKLMDSVLDKTPPPLE